MVILLASHAEGGNGGRARDIITIRGEALTRLQIRPSGRIIGRETDVLPRAAIRTGASINLAAVAGIQTHNANLDLVVIECVVNKLSELAGPTIAPCISGMRPGALTTGP